jgi:hypothetical protein
MLLNFFVSRKDEKIKIVSFIFDVFSKKAAHFFVPYLLPALLLCAATTFVQAQNTYTPCYYRNAAAATELYKNEAWDDALIFFERAHAAAQAYHRADIVAVAACYAHKGDKKRALQLLKTAMDKGRRFDWFQKVYYFETLHTDSAWVALAGYQPKKHYAARGQAYQNLIQGIAHELDEAHEEMAHNAAAAARLRVIDSTAATMLCEIIIQAGLPDEGELDDNEQKEMMGLWLKAGIWDEKTYQFLLPYTEKICQNGIFRAKEYAYIIDTWGAIWAKRQQKIVQPRYGKDDTNLAALTLEEFETMNANRRAIGLLPFGFDISAASLAGITCE